MALPDFLIIGTMKGGTSNLYNKITAHPKIKPAFRKEVGFFCNNSFNNYQKGITWYQKQFPVLRNEEITGEASPDYIFYPYAAERIADQFPDIKLIALLRNPISRAYSHFQMIKDAVRQNCFEECLQKEREIMGNELKKAKNHPDFYSNEFEYYSLLERGKYVEQLKRYFKYHKRSKMLIIKSEDYYQNPSFILNQVFSFLNVESISFKQLQESWISRLERFINDPFLLKIEKVKRKIFRKPPPTDKARRYRALKKTTQKRLKSFFKPYNEELYRLINRDMGWENE